MKNAKERHNETKKEAENPEKKIDVAIELFLQLTPDAQAAIIDLLKSLLSER